MAVAGSCSCEVFISTMVKATTCSDWVDNRASQVTKAQHAGPLEAYWGYLQEVSGQAALAIFCMRSFPAGAT